MIKKIFLVLLFFLKGIQIIFAQSETKSWLWEISGNNLKRPSYLFGTYHPVGNSVFNSLSNTKTILQKCKTLLIEVTKKEIDTNAVKKNQPIIQQDVDNGFEIWNKILNSNQQEIFYKYASKNKRAVYYALSAEEILLELRTIYSLEYCINSRKENDTILTMDEYIESIAIKKKMLIIGLDEKINYTPSPKYNRDNIIKSDSEIVSFMISMMKKMLDSTGKKFVCNELQDYINGTHELLEDSTAKYQPYSTVERNEKWIQIIEENIKKNRCFIAVGNGHFFYNTGLIALLRKKGYKLKPVKMI